ncbi:ABC transporter permease [Enterococcus cecorum]|uniref:Putative hemin transport system permease protein HrtB n=1 Tax=Enterococcus cecorum DSM 20682 = ATCC 43198 TaxID=1121864 RepID=S1RLD8_9ENTE|nr:FtsX-like permease family protein [Enterococcus cecorum]EOX18780.1 efflux ABC transporter permease [Enterococcus cecorum DSM 20682 = ATCC 43198]ESK61491.1 efflux ABC transporter permease [Enterococcus cecorum DSM 20682 = ATCC 43198]MDZ5589230.1 FtsX-like permease family protein [Enterococcus cecorum]OJG34439.1 efflux ABC transporter permease [Enterococcus cecorum DSM 20682 = ATCC 43198]CAI3412983.1 ABC transporter permease [Enterococcus cecorum DSM 20682 = ATCC 43198]
MFLAINEMKHSKLRYALVIGVVFLIAYLVFFLTGLAYGLAQENRTAVDKWQADRILLSDEANGKLNMSMLTMDDYESVKAEDKAALAQFPGIVYQKGKKNQQINVSFFGIEADEFLAPNLVKGRMFKNTGEVVVNDSLAKEDGLQVGDQLKVAGSKQTLKIVGFTDEAMYNVAPVIYMSLADFQEIRFNQILPKEAQKINAIVLREKPKQVANHLEEIKISDFIDDLPGYRAQNLTFAFMIGFLIVIAAIVIGIFIYILTMQKQAIFGVMKAQGISNFFIARSVFVQTAILAFVGIVLGLALTYLSSLVLPAAVPFAIFWGLYLAVSVGMWVIAILSAVFSVSTVVKIDPLQAIS